MLTNDLKMRLRGTSSERFRSLQAEVLKDLQADFAGTPPSWRGNLAKTSTEFRAGWSGRWPPASAPCHPAVRNI